MNQYPKYKVLISEMKRISRERVVPYGVYKISTYKTVDNAWKSLKGQDETIIFTTGVYEGNISALKLSVVTVDEFFKWFKPLVTNTSFLEDDTINNIPLYLLAKPFDGTGKHIYERFIKNNPLIQRMDRPYRVYKLRGIQHIQEIVFKKEILKRYYG